MPKMEPFSIKNCLILLFLCSLTANVYSQSNKDLLLSGTEILPQNFTQIFTDPRDGKKYPIISSNDRYWLNTNLNYKTEDSDCLDDMEDHCKSLGRLYSWKEAQSVCPTNWKLPDVQDFRNLFKEIAIEEEGFESGIFIFPYSWANFNSDNPARIKINQNGMKLKRKYLDKESFNLWLRPSTETDASYIHGVLFINKKEKTSCLTLFPHHDENKNSIKMKSKFGVRCVIPISEFNKLSINNG